MITCWIPVAVYLHTQITYSGGKRGYINVLGNKWNTKKFLSHQLIQGSIAQNDACSIKGSQPAWDVPERSQSDLHWEKHLRDLSERSQKRRLFWDVFKTSQIHLKKDVFFVTSVRRLRNISKKTSFVWRL